MTNTKNLYAAPSLSIMEAAFGNVNSALTFFVACNALRGNKAIPENEPSVEVLFSQADMFLKALNKSSTVSSNMGSLAATEKTYIQTLMNNRITGQGLIRGFQRLQKRAADCKKECEELKAHFSEIAKTLRDAHPEIIEYQNNKSSSATKKAWIAKILIAAAIAAGIATGGTAMIAAGIVEEALGLALLAAGAGAGGVTMHRFAGKELDAINTIKEASDGVEKIIQVLNQFADFWDEWDNNMKFLANACQRCDDDGTYAIDRLEGEDLIRQWHDAEHVFNRYSQQSREWFHRIEW